MTFMFLTRRLNDLFNQLDAETFMLFNVQAVNVDERLSLLKRDLRHDVLI